MKLLLSLLAAIWLIVALPAINFAQDPDAAERPRTPHNSTRTQDLAKVKETIIEVQNLQFEVRSREIACKLAELRVEAAKLDEAQAELRIKYAQERGAKEEVEHLTLERRQLALRMQASKLELEMARLELDRARKVLERLVAPSKEKSSILGEVRVEFIEPLGLIILRGAKEDVKKIAELIKEMDQ